MDGNGSIPAVIRHYEDSDRETLEKFKCGWRKWEKDAQRLIRNGPMLFADGSTEIFVAEFDNQAIGAVLFRLSPGEGCEIFSIGVLRPYQNRHVGTQLKKAVMVESEFRQPGCVVTSTVHVQNHRMNKINANLLAVTERITDSPELLLTMVGALIEN
jgi:ribosomal protein S18 acetylase RimI-like enzyme